MLPLEDRRAQRCSSLVATAQELRSVLQRYHRRLVDELSVYGADGETNLVHRQLIRDERVAYLFQSHSLPFPRDLWEFPI